MDTTGNTVYSYLFYYMAVNLFLILNHLIFVKVKSCPMMKREDYIHQLTTCKQYLMQKFGLRSIRLFGSVARGDNHEDSDLDVCVETDSPNPFLLMDLKEELESMFKHSVDIVRYREHMNPYLRQQIDKEGVYV